MSAHYDSNAVWAITENEFSTGDDKYTIVEYLAAKNEWLEDKTQPKGAA